MKSSKHDAGVKSPLTDSTRRRQRGFTLLEVMVALSVLALSSVALLTNINQATRDLGGLKDKLLALSIAEYALNAVLLDQSFPDTGRDDEVVTHGSREWLVDIEISETPSEDIRRIDVTVRPNLSASEGDNPPTVLLSGFRANIY